MFLMKQLSLRWSLLHHRKKTLDANSSNANNKISGAQHHLSSACDCICQLHYIFMYTLYLLNLKWSKVMIDIKLAFINWWFNDYKRLRFNMVSLGKKNLHRHKIKCKSQSSGNKYSLVNNRILFSKSIQCNRTWHPWHWNL